MLTVSQFEFYMAFWVRLIDSAYDDNIHETNVYKHAHIKQRVINSPNLLKSLSIIPHTWLMWILFIHVVYTTFFFNQLRIHRVLICEIHVFPSILFHRFSVISHLLHRFNTYIRTHARIVQMQMQSNKQNIVSD